MVLLHISVASVRMWIMPALTHQELLAFYQRQLGIGLDELTAAIAASNVGESPKFAAILQRFNAFPVSEEAKLIMLFMLAFDAAIIEAIAANNDALSQ